MVDGFTIMNQGERKKNLKNKCHAFLQANKGEFANLKQIAVNENQLEMLAITSTESVDGASLSREE